MKKHRNIVLGIIGGVVVLSVLGGIWAAVSKKLWPVVPSEWMGTWVLDKETSEGKFHGVLTIAGVDTDSMDYDLTYTIGEATGGSSAPFNRGDTFDIAHRKIIHMTYAYVSGHMLTKTTFRLSRDKQSIQKETDNCPRLVENQAELFSPDGCEMPVDDGVYVKTDAFTILNTINID